MAAPDAMSGDALVREIAALCEQQRAISAVLRAVVRSAGLQPVLDEVVEAATQLTGSKNGRLWVCKEGMLHVAASCGAREGLEYDREHPEPPNRTSMAGRVALTRDVVHLPDVDADPEYTYAGPRHYGSGLGVPIMLDDELIGTIGIVRNAVGPFGDDQIELVRMSRIRPRSRSRMLGCSRPSSGSGSSCRDSFRRRLLTLSRASEESNCSPATARTSPSFSAICAGFTAFAETAAPEDLLDLLREYHALMGDLIGEHSGTIEHFAGDGLMVFFNDPVPLEKHELLAVHLAQRVQHRFADVAAGWRKRGIDLGIGIGIAAGYATLGRIGFEGRYDYGALGPVTNLASRLSSEAATGEILISAPVFAAVEGEVDVQPAGQLELKGFSRPLSVHRVAAVSDS